MIEEFEQRMDACNQHLEAATEPMHVASDYYEEAAVMLRQIDAKLGETATLWLKVRQLMNDVKGPISTSAEEVRTAWESVEPLGLQDSDQPEAQAIAERLPRYALALERHIEQLEANNKAINEYYDLFSVLQIGTRAYADSAADLISVGQQHKDFVRKIGYLRRHI